MKNKLLLKIKAVTLYQFLAVKIKTRLKTMKVNYKTDFNLDVHFFQKDLFLEWENIR